MQKIQINICLFILTTIVFTGCTNTSPSTKASNSTSATSKGTDTASKDSMPTSTSTPRTNTPAAASEPELTPTQTSIPTQTLTTANVNLTDNEVKDILNGLIPSAVAIYGTFNGNGAFKSDVTKTIPGEKDYCLVTNIRRQNGNGNSLVDMSNVKSIADLKKSCRKRIYKRYRSKSILFAILDAG